MNKTDFRYTQISAAMNASKSDKRFQHKLAIGVMALGLALSVASTANADTFTVTNTNDSGPGSFSEAVQLANANPGKDEINLSNVAGQIATTARLIIGEIDLVGPGAERLTLSSGLNIKGTSKLLNSSSVSGLAIDGPLDVDDTKLALSESKLKGLTLYNAPTTITDSEISESNGRGIYMYGSDVNARNLTMRNNSSSVIISPGLEDGYGKIYGASNFNCDGCVLTGNTGGIYIRSGELRLTNTDFSNNTGQILSDGSLVEIHRSSITGNEGGLVVSGSDSYQLHSRVKISDSVIVNNASNGLNFNYAETVYVGNSTISGNDGRGIVNSGAMTIINSTIVNNKKGGISKRPSSSSYYKDEFLRVNNSIIANNPNNAYGDLAVQTNFTGSIEIIHSLIRTPGTAQITDVVPGSNLIGIDPLLAPLADNGGPTLTHALLASSPAIDAGDNATCLSTDQRGVTRPQGAACDIGAYEVEDVIVPPVAICDLPPVAVGGICSGEFLARSVEDVEAFVAGDYGKSFNPDGKPVYQNLRLLGDLGEPGVALDVTMPCRITVNAGSSLTGSDITLHARQGVAVNWGAEINASGEACVIADKQNALLNGGNVVNANNLAIRGAKKSIIGFRSNLSVNDTAELISTGSDADSLARIANKSVLTTGDFTMKADGIAEVAYQADVSTTGVLSITSGNQPNSETLIFNRSNLQAGTDLTLNSQGKTTIGFHTTVTAGNNLDVNAVSESDCSVANITSVSYSSKSGNCSDKLP